jgi:hypothetical protein
VAVSQFSTTSFSTLLAEKEINSTGNKSQILSPLLSTTFIFAMTRPKKSLQFN